MLYYCGVCVYVGGGSGQPPKKPKYATVSPHVNTTYTVFSIKLYNLTILCLNGTLPCVDFMEVIVGDIPFQTINVLKVIYTFRPVLITSTFQAALVWSQLRTELRPCTSGSSCCPPRQTNDVWSPRQLGVSHYLLKSPRSTSYGRGGGGHPQ